MKYIDESIIEAFHQMRAITGKKNSEIAVYLGISPQHINKIYNHDKSLEYFRDTTWAKIEPKLRPYLEKKGTIKPIETDEFYQDGYFQELKKTWKKFNSTEKLQILSYADEILNSKNTPITNRINGATA